MGWLAGFARQPHKLQGGTFVAGAAKKLVLHTTEGMSAYPEDVPKRAAGAPYPPHFWVSPEHRVALQLIDDDRSAYALLHRDSDPETNRAGAIQVEIEGFAARSHLWPVAWLDWLADEVVKPICEAHGIDPTKTRKWWGAGDGEVLASFDSAARMGWAEWWAFNGVCGHQHVPGNLHWDPGQIQYDEIVFRIREGEWFEMATKAELRDVVAAQVDRLGRRLLKIEGKGVWLLTTDAEGALRRYRVRSGEDRLLRTAGVVEGDPVRLESAEAIAALQGLPIAG